MLADSAIESSSGTLGTWGPGIWYSPEPTRLSMGLGVILKTCFLSCHTGWTYVCYKSMATLNDDHYYPVGANGMNGLGIKIFNVPNAQLPRQKPDFAPFLPYETWSQNGMVQDRILKIQGRAGPTYMATESLECWQELFRTLPETPADVPSVRQPEWSFPFDQNPSRGEPGVPATSVRAPDTVRARSPAMRSRPVSLNLVYYFQQLI
jgi:hypothetical protein